MHRYVVTLVVCGLLAGSIDAAAQGREWTDRGYANLNLGFQPGSGDIEATNEFPIYQETGRVTAIGQVDGGPLFDLSGGVRVWKNVSVGLGYHHLGSDAAAAVSGTVPHPVFTDRPREFATDVRALERSENAVHLSFGYMFVVNDKLDVLVMGGPSFFWLSQEVVSSVAIGESGPPFTSVVTDAQITKQKDSPVGGHIGADVTYKLYERGKITMGGGAFLRYAGASGNVVVVDRDADADVGGFQFGFGLRTRF